MRISDWSSDVCSSDLARRRRSGRAPGRRTALSCPCKDRILALLWDHFGNWRSPEFKCELSDQRSADTVHATDSCLKHRLAEIRSEGRRVGQACVSTGIIRWPPDNYQKIKSKKN